MVYFVGAGCGAPDLITVRGKNLLEKADVIIYAGSLVNPELLSYAKKEAKIYNSAYMTLEEVMAVMEEEKDALILEFTLPQISQTLIITRQEGRTKVPPKEKIESLAAHQASMAIYLSAGMLDELRKNLMAGGYDAHTPAALVYKATWQDEQAFVCTVDTLPQVAKEHGITKTAIVLVGDVIAHSHYERSRLYAPDFEAEFRRKQV